MEYDHTHFTFLIFIITALLITITPSQFIFAQQPVLTVDPTGTCSPYIGDPPNQQICNQRLINPNSIYSNQSNSQQARRQQVYEISFLLDAISCSSSAALNALCTKSLGECVVPTNQTLTQPIVLQSQLCKKSCLTITSTCNNPMVGQYVNCNDAQLFPENYTLYDLSPYGGSDQYQVPCTDSLLIVGPNDTVASCPFPLFSVNRSDPQYAKDKGYTFVGDTSCLVPCPVPIYTNGTWDGIFTMSTVLSSVSFVCISFNIVTYGILTKDFTKFSISLLCFSLSIWVMNIMDIVTSGIGHVEVFCPAPGKYAQQDDATCSVTGSLFHLGVVGSILYWVTMSMQLWTSIKRIDLKLLQPKYSIIVISICQVVLLIIPLSLKSIKAGGGAVSCWVSGKWEQNGVYWFPVSIALGIGIFFIFMVLKEIYVIVRNIHHDKRFLRLQIKPFLCVLLIGGSFIYCLATHFYFEANDDRYNENAELYLKCLLQGGDPNECTVDGPPYLRFFFFHFLIRMFGIFVFLLYGLTAKSKQIWMESFVVQYPPIKRRLVQIGILDSRNINSTTNTSGEKKPNSHTTYMESKGNTAASSDVDSIEMNSFQAP